MTQFGRWWTILSASWLHGSAVHIIFNMLSVRQLAPAVAELFGPGRMVIIYTAGGVAGFALSVFWGLYLPPIPLLGGGGGITIGASACITGLLGAIYYYGHRSGSTHGPQLRDAIDHLRADLRGFSLAGSSTTSRTSVASPEVTPQPECSTP